MVLINIESEKVSTDEVVSMMGMNDLESDVRNKEVNILDFKDNLRLLLKKWSIAMVYSLINLIEKLSAEKDQLINDF